MKRIKLSELRRLIRKTIAEEYLPNCPECGEASIRNEHGVEELPRADRLLCAACAGLGGHWKCSDCEKWNRYLESSSWKHGEEPCVHCGSSRSLERLQDEKTIIHDRF